MVELSKKQKQEDLLHRVTCLLAVEAIAYWLKPKKYPLSRQRVLKLLGIDIHEELSDDGEGELALLTFLEKQRQKKYRSLAGYRKELELVKSLKEASSNKVGSLVDELKIRLENLYKNQSVNLNLVEDISNFFDLSEDYLKKRYFTTSRKTGFTSFSVALKDNSVRVQEQLSTRLEDLIFYGIENSNLSGSLNFLAQLSKDFQTLEQEFLEEKEICIDQENACFRTYSKRLAVLKNKNEDDLEKLAQNFQVAQAALFHFYAYKIEAETYSLAAQAVARMESMNQLYLGRFRDSKSFLAELQALFLAETNISNGKALLPFVLENLSTYLDLDDLLYSLEQKIGQTLPSWGRLKDVTKEMVRSALYLELEPIAEKICSDIYFKLGQKYLHK